MEIKSQKAKVKSETTAEVSLQQRCYLFSLAVLRLTDDLPQKRSSWVISDQIIRSATSIGANLVEGKSASSRLEFKRYYEISLKSANETKYWLGLLRDAKLVVPEKVDHLLGECDELSLMLGAAVLKLKRGLKK